MRTCSPGLAESENEFRANFCEGTECFDRRAGNFDNDSDVAQAIDAGEDIDVLEIDGQATEGSMRSGNCEPT